VSSGCHNKYQEIYLEMPKISTKQSPIHEEDRRTLSTGSTSMIMIRN